MYVSNDLSGRVRRRVKEAASLVKAINTNSINRIITESVIRIGKASGFNVVAEGIETEGELSLLKRIRCPHGQGYLLAKPENSDSFMSRLQNGAS